jgi:outer membrane protein insertion porin family
MAQDGGVGADEPYEGSMVVRVRFEGLNRTSPQLLWNNLRTTEGAALDWEVVREDVRTLERLGRFSDIEAGVESSGGGVAVVFTFIEAPIVEDVVVVGNRQLTDEEIREVVQDSVRLASGVPIDEFQIGQAQSAIEDLYRTKGYYQVEVSIDKSELGDSGIVVFRVREGERIKVTSIRFEGNESFLSKELRPSIKTRIAGWFNAGPLDDGVLDRDVAALVRFYKDRGYIDVRASREITPSPNGKEAIVAYVIDEGRLYTLRSVVVRNANPGARTFGFLSRDIDEAQVRALVSEEDFASLRAYGLSSGQQEGLERASEESGFEEIRAWVLEAVRRNDRRIEQPLDVLTPEQVAGIMEIKRGDVYSVDRIRKSVGAIREAYLKMGYVDSSVVQREIRANESSEVDLVLSIREGGRYRTGMVHVQGNDLTQQKVIRREIQNRPDRWLDATEVTETQRRLNEGQLFAPNARVTIQAADPDMPGFRDVLVQVEETNTGRVSFGAAVSSDSGVAGLINLNQRNFDLFDTPDSVDEFVKGRSFRGAGQTFNLMLQPGTEQSVYSVALTEPDLFETPYSVTGEVFFRDREFDEYDEERYGGRLGFGRRFGRQWTGNISLRAESIQLSEIDPGSSVDVFEVEDRQEITSLGFGLIRTTADSRFRPSKGARTEIGFERVGLLGGDFDYTKLTAEHQVFITLDEDILGRKTVLKIEGRVGVIPEEDEAPVFERFYLGGRSFRGFRFRGIGPVGIKNNSGKPGDDHVGGDMLLFAGMQVERPMWKDMFAVVGFVDSGTISDDIEIEEYRVTAGFGIRLYLPQFGNAPLAFDFAFPVVKESTDETQVFSFSIDVPF